MKATVFFDGQFEDGDWEDLFIRCTSRKQVHVQNVSRKIDILGRALDASSIYASSAAKGRSRQTTITAQRAPAGEEPHKHIAASLVHLNRTATFDPSSQGKVESIDFYLDLMHADGTPGVEVHYAVVIKQGGVFFQSPPARLAGVAKKWKGFVSESLVADDFIRIGRTTVVSPHTRPLFSKDAEPMQFGYIVHVAGPGSSLKSVTSIGEWKVSVAHREDLGMSLLQTQEFKQRLDSEVSERQRLERVIVEQRIKAEQELREAKLKAEEEMKSLRMSLPIAERRGSEAGAVTASFKGLGRTEDLSQLLSGAASPVDDKYLSIVKATQERMQQFDSRRKEKLEEERERMRKTLVLERQGREDAERKWAAQCEEVAKSAGEEKRQLSEELASYRKRIFHLEQELRSECKLKDEKEEELRRLHDEMAGKQEQLQELLGKVDQQAAAIERHEAERKRFDEELERLTQIIAEKAATIKKLEDEVCQSSALLDQCEREWKEVSARRESEIKEAQEAARAEIEAWQQRVAEGERELAAQKELLEKQLADEKAQLKAQLDEELAKTTEAYERKDEAWKRTAKELIEKLNASTQSQSATTEANQELQATLADVKEQLAAAQAQVAQRDERTKELDEALAERSDQLRDVIMRAQDEMNGLRTAMKRQEEEREQERRQVELERAEAKRNAESMAEKLQELENTLADVRSESTARAKDLNDTHDRIERANAQSKQLVNIIKQLKAKLEAKQEKEHAMAASITELENQLLVEQDAHRQTVQSVEQLRTQIEAERKLNKDHQRTSATAAAEKAALAESLAAEKEAREQLTKELESLKDSYDLEKTLREKIARELFAEIDARKESEKRQASVIAALNDHLMKQTETIVQLDHVLKQEHTERIELEEQVKAEVVARIKAEEALSKLYELFRNAAKEDTEWELVTEEEGATTQ